MMEFKEDGIITVDKVKKKKVKCYKFHNEILDRPLMLHKDIDNQELISLSDFITGYRLFNVHIKENKLELADIEERLEKYIEHFTADGIQEEIEKLQQQEINLRKTK